MIKNIFILFSLIICSFIQNSLSYPPNSDVVELTDRNFDSHVMNSKEKWMVDFYAPWCGHCVKMEPEYMKAATQAKGKFKLGAVNAQNEKALAKRFDIRGLPTIKIFGDDKKNPTEYRGERNAKSFIKALEAK